MTSQLVQFQDNDRTFQLMQNSWASMLNPLLQNPSLQSTILPQIVLKSGTNTINHRLGRKLQGWRTIRINAAATLYDLQDTNPHPELTLQLVSNAPVTVYLEVF